MNLNVHNKGTVPRDMNEAYYVFDPLYSMKDIDIPFQKGEQTYSLKKGYCYVVDPEERRNGGDDETHGYVAVVNQKGDIVADFIDQGYDLYENVLKGKLAVAELLSERYELNVGESKIDSYEFLEDVYDTKDEEYMYEYDEEKTDEYNALIRESVDRQFEVHKAYFEIYLNDYQKYLELAAERFPEDVKKEMKTFNDQVKKIQEEFQTIPLSIRKKIVQTVGNVVSKVNRHITTQINAIKDALQKGRTDLQQLFMLKKEVVDKKRIENMYVMKGYTDAEKTYCKAFLNGDSSLDLNNKNDLEMRSNVAMRELVLSGEYSDRKIIKIITKLSPLNQAAKKISSDIHEMKSKSGFKSEKAHYQSEHGIQSR